MDPRESGAFITEIAKDVKISEAGIECAAREIARAIKAKEFVPSNIMIHSYPMPSVADEASVEWLFVVDTLNFSFWVHEDKHYTIDHKGTKYTGCMALCAAVTKALEDGIPITSASYYSQITLEDIEAIFSSGLEFPIPMAEERMNNLCESGRILNEIFGGSFSNCVKQCNGSAKQLLELIVSSFPSFRDEAMIEGKKVSLYKRAQILVADIWCLFKGQDLGKFDDIDCITMFADYRVPQALVHFGAIKYSEELSDRLRKNHVFQNGDREEVEIRGVSINACELIHRTLQRDHGELMEGSLRINSAMIDFFLWEYRRRHAQDLLSIPYHKVRSIYY